MKDCCPYCNTLIDCDTSTRNTDTPSVGDIAICFCCSGIMRFKKIYEEGGRDFEKITPQYLKEIKAEEPETFTHLTKAVYLIRQQQKKGVTPILFSEDIIASLLNPQLNAN
jgi:hypothetical protein